MAAKKALQNPVGWAVRAKLPGSDKSSVAPAVWPQPATRKRLSESDEQGRDQETQQGASDDVAPPMEAGVHCPRLATTH